MTTRGPQCITEAACCRYWLLLISLYPSVFFFLLSLNSRVVGTEEVQVAVGCVSQDFSIKN